MSIDCLNWHFLIVSPVSSLHMTAEHNSQKRFHICFLFLHWSWPHRDRFITIPAPNVHRRCCCFNRTVSREPPVTCPGSPQPFAGHIWILIISNYTDKWLIPGQKKSVTPTYPTPNSLKCNNFIFLNSKNLFIFGLSIQLYFNVVLPLT